MQKKISFFLIALLACTSIYTTSDSLSNETRGSNLRLLEKAADTLFSGVAWKTFDSKKVCFTYKGDSQYKPVFSTSLSQKLNEQDMNLKEKEECCELRLNMLSLEINYPRAFRDGLFGKRRVMKTLSLKCFLSIKEGSKVITQKKSTVKLNREISFSRKDNLEQSLSLLTGKIEHYKPNFYLWEPVLLTIATSSFVYLIFSNR